MAGYLASCRDKQVQFDEIKAMFFLLRAYQKRYSFLLKQLRDRYNGGRDEYTVMTTLSLFPLIHTEGGIWGNQKLSAYESSGGRVGRQKNERMGHSFTH